METEGLKNSASTSNKPSLKKLRICLYVSGLAISSINLIIPYFGRELQPYCDSSCLSLVLSLFAIARLLASLITGLYICELGARNSIVNNLVLNTASLILISFVPRIVRYMVTLNGNSDCALGNISSLDDTNSTSNDTSSVFWSENCMNTLPTYIICSTCFSCLGWSYGGYQTALFAVVTKQFQDKLSPELARREIVLGVTIIFLPALGGIILEYILDDYMLVGILSVSLGAVPLIITMIFMPEIESCEPSKIKEGLKLLKNVNIQLPFIIVIMAYGVWFSLEALTTGHITQFIGKGDAIKNGLPWTMVGISYAGTAKFWGSVSNKHPRITMISSVILMSISLVLFDDRYLISLFGEDFIDQNFRYWYFCAVVFIIGAVLTGPAVATYQEINEVVMKDLKMEDNLATMGLISSCWNFGYSMSNVVGPLFFGFIGSYVGFVTAMHVHALCLVVLIAGTGVYHKTNPRIQ